MTNINPRRIRGAWDDGLVLDVHSTGSLFLGYDEYGHPVFDTQRTEMGELLYRLKYRSDRTALAEIGAVAAEAIRRWKIRFDAVVPVPPTRSRAVQPVLQVAAEIAGRFAVPCLSTAIGKIRSAAELKNIHEFDERREALEDAFTVDGSQIVGKQVLLVDDLIRSGATMNTVAEALTGAGAAAVYAFALTRTRRV